MDAPTARGRVAAAPVGHLATVTPGGRPHVVPCCFALQGQWLYSAVDDKPKSTPQLRRLANIEAHPAVSVLVDHYDDDWSELWWIRMDGTAQLWDSGPRRAEAIAALATKYGQYREEAPPGPVIAVEISAWRWWP
jgi:PPOX class probable F420-dependent enzyme